VWWDTGNINNTHVVASEEFTVTGSQCEFPDLLDLSPKAPQQQNQRPLLQIQVFFSLVLRQYIAVSIYCNITLHIIIIRRVYCVNTVIRLIDCG